VLAHDVTSMLRTEEELRRNRQQLQTILDSTTEGICGTDVNGICTFCNARCVALLGHKSAATLLNKKMHALCHAKPADGSPYPEGDYPIGRSNLENQPCHVTDEVFWRADGTSFPVEYWSHPVSENGTRMGSVVTFFDISERKRTEEALWRSEQQYSQIMKNAPYGIYRVDGSGRILIANPAFAKMLGYASEDEVLSLNTATDVYWEAEGRRTAVARFDEVFFVQSYEAEWKRKDGKKIMVRLAGRKAPGNANTPSTYEVFVENITEQLLLEKQLIQSQKMEAVGLLAGGIAHDFNNLLGIIIGQSELVLEKFGAEDPLRNRVLEITKAGKRAATLTRQLLTFSR